MTGKILLEKWYSRQMGCGFVQQRAAEVKVNPVLHRQAEQMSLLYGFWDTLGASSLFSCLCMVSSTGSKPSLNNCQP